MVILGVALAGGAGALIRWLVSTWFSSRAPGGAATAVVNLAGAFCLGAVAGLCEAGRLDPDLGVVLQAGLLGSLTTFSTWMVETVEASIDNRAALWRRTVPVTLAGMALVWTGALWAGV